MSRRSGLLSYRSGKTLFILFALLILLLVLPTVAVAATVEEPSASVPPPGEPGLQVDMDWGRMPLYFIANQGLMDEAVAYYVDGQDKTLYFTTEGLTIALAGASTGDTGAEVASAERWTVKLDYLGARAVTPRGGDEAGATISYFSGAPEDWQAGLPTYSSIVYEELWEGIDLVYSGTTDQLKHEFVLQPGADPDQIRLVYRGAEVTLGDGGELVVSTPAGSFTDSAPIAYQEIDGQRVAVPVQFVLGATSGEGAAASTEYGFSLGDYDPALPLVIDPALLVYCGYVGGSASESSLGIAIDDSGCAYIVGNTFSNAATFPVAVGPDLVIGASGDAFVAKVNAAGTALVYCGYIGGDDSDEGKQVAVDSSGNAYVCGQTDSSEATFPVLVGPDLTKANSSDVFVAKVNAAGTALVYCGYIGGDSTDFGGDIAVDSSGYAYVTGHVYSSQTTFPVTVGPDLTYGGDRDAFIAKVNTTGSALVYCGYIGGDGSEAEANVAVDSLGRAYVAGVTNSSQASFPVTVGPDLTYNTGGDAYVARVNAAGTALEYCGYIGGASADQCLDVVVDSSFNAYVSGDTKSDQSTFPVTVGPYLTYGGSTDAFVAKINSAGSALVYCGYIGGDDLDTGWGVAVDSSGVAYVCGETSSSEATFPVIGGPGLTWDAQQDAFVAKLNPTGTSLELCGYLGAGGSDEAYAAAADDSGNLYISGFTFSASGFPLVVGPDLTHNGSGEAFVAKIATQPTRYQESDSNITYLGDWTTSGSWYASGFSFASTDQPGAAAIVKFEGPYVGVLARTTPWYGEVELTLDPGTTGEETTVVDLWSSSVVWKARIYEKNGLDPGQHTLVIKCLGTNDHPSWAASISLDAIDLFGPLVQAPTVTRFHDSNEFLEYTPEPDWTMVTGDWKYSNGDFSSIDDGGSVAVEFNGSYLAWYGSVRRWYGKAMVVLDEGLPGEQVTIVDLWRPYEADKQRLYNTGLLEDTNHTLAIYWTGDYNWSSWGTRIGVDSFDVLGYLLDADSIPPIEWRYQQNHPKITYLGDWSTTSTWSASGGSFASTSQPRASAVIRFQGESVTVLSRKTPWYGQAEVTLDPGPLQVTFIVDLWSSSVAWKVPIFSQGGLSPGDHTLVVKCTGMSNGSSWGTTVALDALDVVGYLKPAPQITRIQEDNLIYNTYLGSGWVTSLPDWSASGGYYKSTDVLDDRVTCHFVGSYISLLSRSTPWYGKVDIELWQGDVDTGTLIEFQTVDLYSSSVIWKKPVYSSGYLPEDEYTLAVYCRHEKYSASWWYTIAVDAFDVMLTSF